MIRARVPLGKFVTEYTVRNKKNENIPVYSVTNSQGFCSEYFGKEVASQDKSTYKIVPKGYFAYNPSRINVGSVDWQRCEDRVIVSPLYNVFSVSNEIDRQYLYYFLRSDLGRQMIRDKASGSVRDNLKLEMLKELTIPNISLTEQKYCVSVLDKLLLLILLRQQELQQLDELVKSRFIELFGLPVSNSKGWNTEKMREVAPAVNYSGGFEDTVWLLNLDMVEAQTGRILDYLYVNEEEVGNSTCTFDTTNVLYSKLRPYLNKVVIPDRCGYATSELIPLKPNPMKLERTYLAFMLRSDEFVNMINEKVAGAKMPRVSMSDFKEFDVPVPPMELQKQFDAFVEQTDKSKLAVHKSLEKLETLKKALMQKYFG